MRLTLSGAHLVVLTFYSTKLVLSMASDSKLAIVYLRHSLLLHTMWVNWCYVDSCMTEDLTDINITSSPFTSVTIITTTVDRPFVSDHFVERCQPLLLLDLCHNIPLLLSARNTAGWSWSFQVPLIDGWPQILAALELISWRTTLCLRMWELSMLTASLNLSVWRYVFYCFVSGLL